MAPDFKIRFNLEDNHEPKTSRGEFIKGCIIAALLGALFMMTVGHKLWPIEHRSATIESHH